MSNKNLLRIGVFYDGSYFTYAQHHYNTLPGNGWIVFEPLHELIEQIISEKEQGFSSYKVVYASWFQGIKHSKQTEGKHLVIERNRHIDLIDAGVELKFTHNNHEQNEKGVDVKMALEVLQIALDDKIDVAVLITGDGDFIPLVRALMKQGKRVLLFYFDYENNYNKSFANKKLINACNYVINFNEIEDNKSFRPHFKNLFRKNK
jgi:uncharacterized LabA/DUF88 family protein